MRRRDQVYGWLRERPLVVDSVLAVVLFLVCNAIIRPLDPYSAVNAVWIPYIGPAALPIFSEIVTVLLVGGLTLPLAVRRVRPVWAGGLVAATCLVQWVLGLPMQMAQVGVLIAVHALAAYGPRWASRGGFVLALAGAPMAAVRYFSGSETIFVVTVGMAGLVLAAWALGDLQRVRRQQLEALRERARRLEVEREQESRLAASDERARIAREMHDVVAHSLSVVIAQADGGRYAADGDPQAAVRACETISQTGRAALTDMRRLLGVLRTDDGASRSPTPGLEDLDALIDGVRDSGLPVRYATTGEPRPVPSGIELAVYRIIQEALTNVLKHAGPEATAVVQVSWTPAGLMISVIDDGRGAAADSALRAETGGAGHGIPGMTERATLYGGRLQAAPVPGGGFAVRAHVPYPSTETMRG